MPLLLVFTFQHNPNGSLSSVASFLFFFSTKVSEITHIHTVQAAKRSHRSECEVGGPSSCSRAAAVGTEYVGLNDPSLPSWVRVGELGNSASGIVCQSLTPEPLGLLASLENERSLRTRRGRRKMGRV